MQQIIEIHIQMMGDKMAYIVSVKGKNKELARKQMIKIQKKFGDEIENISGPFDELPVFVVKRGYTAGDLSPALERTRNSLKKAFEENKRPVSVYEVKENNPLSRNLLSGYLNDLVERGYAEKIPNTIGVKYAHVLFKPKRKKNLIN